jgi:hypothetical protein
MGKIQSNDMESVMTTPLNLCERLHLLCFLGELGLQMLECSVQHKIPLLYRNHSLQTLGASGRKPEIAVQNNQLPHKAIQFKKCLQLNTNKPSVSPHNTLILLLPFFV